MPKRRKPSTGRKRQEDRQLRARGVRRDEPDARKLSRAFIGLALARAEAEAQADAERRTQPAAEEKGQKGDPEHGSG